MARKIEKMKRVETRRVEDRNFHAEPWNQRRGHKLWFRFGYWFRKVKNYRLCPTLCLSTRFTRSPLRFESDTLNIEEFKPLYRFEFKRSIWLVSRFSKFRLNFPISGTIESLQRRHHRRDETIVMKSRRLIVVNGGVSRGQWAGDFDDGTKFLPSGYRGWLIYLGRHTADYVPRMRASLSPAGDLVGKVAQYSRLYSVKLSKTQSIWWDGFQCLSPARHRRNNESSNEKCWDAGERSNLSDNRIRGRREKRNGKKRDIWSMEGSSPTILIARLIDRRRGLAVYLVYW